MSNPKPRSDLEFVGCRSVALAMVGAGAFLFALAAKAGWHVTAAVLRRMEARRG